MSLIPGIIVACLVVFIVYVALLCTTSSDIRDVRLGFIILSVYSAIAINWAIKTARRFRR